LILFLGSIVLCSVFQATSAVPFFDAKVMLRWKADPGLRTLLGEPPTDRPVSVLLVFSEVPSPGQLDVLNSIGTISTFTGHVAAVTLPWRSLDKLAAVSVVDHIYAPRTLKPQLDLSVPDILANQVWTTVKDAHGVPVNGAGVAIGIIDTGIDYTHPDFYFKNGTTKVLYIWDQSVDGTHPIGLDYGEECAQREVEVKVCPEFDGGGPWASTTYAGHGTAVAAIAASTGLAAGNYVGVAPGASIIAVKLVDGAENHVLDGFNYVVTKARSLGLPLVINYSFGESISSHDGTEPLEMALTDFAEKEGIPIVIPAGNDRDKSVHVDGRLRPGEHVSVNWASSNSGQNTVDLWYSVSDTIAISVRTPTGFIVTGPTSDSGVDTPDGNVVIFQDQRKTGKELEIFVTPPATSTAASAAWSFTLTGLTIAQGRWDAWTQPGSFFPALDIGKPGYLIDPSDTIDYPGNSVGVITVGSYETRSWWLGRCTPCMLYNQRPTTINGLQGNWTTLGDYASVVGDLAFSSGAGPTRDGRIKPEITAPGVNIVAARANNFPLDRPKPDAPDDFHKVWRGTSFAAPQVAGVIALMLQMNPYLSPNEIKSILTQDARQDAYTGRISRDGSPLWGWGKLNALKSTLNAPTLYTVRLEISSAHTSLSTNVTLDGHNIQTVTLNVTQTLVLEFQGNSTHTIQVAPILQADAGTRYFANDSWSFSSGGSKNIAYQLQFYLQVQSPHGSTTGTGWYDANSTATASVEPTSVPGFRFFEWAGASSSTSSTIEVTMGSSKSLVAQWEQTPTPNPTTSSLALLVILVIGLISVAVVIRLRSRFHI
jgi:subtilisin family serine protease